MVAQRIPLSPPLACSLCFGFCTRLLATAVDTCTLVLCTCRQPLAVLVTRPLYSKAVQCAQARTKKKNLKGIHACPCFSLSQCKHMQQRASTTPVVCGPDRRTEHSLCYPCEAEQLVPPMRKECTCALGAAECVTRCAVATELSALWICALMLL